MPPFRVFVVDDDPLFLTLTELCLSADSHLTIVGCASSGAAALQQIPQVQPDVVLMDVQLGALNGFETTARLKAHSDAPKVILMSSSDYGATLQTVAEVVGADGCLTKLAFIKHACSMIHAVMGEAAVVCSGSSQERCEVRSGPILCRCDTT